MSYTTKLELRDALLSILQNYNLTQSCINQLLSDVFIDGAFELTQNEPENDDFMSFVKSFSENQNLYSIADAQDKIATELCQEGYFTNIFQYVIDAWRDIDISADSISLNLMTNNNNEEDITPEDVKKANIITNIAMKILNIPNPAKAVVNEFFLWGKITVAVNNQDKKFYDIADRFSQELWAVATGARGAFSTAHEQASPLALDLDGDGVETTTVESGVYFDHDDNGFAEKSGWVGKDDGLLVRDINNNGLIDDGTELFGNNSVLSSGEKAANGFEALADLDSNSDGVFNSSDAAWNQVKVWKDANQNGEVDSGELLTLEQAGVSGINLNYENETTTDENGNQHKQTGTFIKTDGTTGSVHDVWFDADYANTMDTTDVEISDTIAALPNIQGFGNVHDLHTAMALDTELKTLIEQYIAEDNAAARKAMIDNIIFHWAGVEDVDPLSRKPSYFYDNPIGDARYLETLEKFLGQKYSNRYWFGQEEENPHEQASKFLLQGYDILAAYVSNELEAQTHCKTLLENIEMTWNEQTQTWNIDISGAVNILNGMAETNLDNAINILHSLEDIVKQQNIMVDAINAAFQNQSTETNELQMYYMNFGKFENKISNGNDIIYGTEDNNYINGLAGNDKIYGEDGNDTLIGGAGHDYLVGGTGSDTYFFEGSWGHDSIDNSSTDEKGTNPDKIVFGEGILPSDVTIQRRANDLILSLHNGADTVTVYSYFLEAGTTTNTVDTIEFADGTVWNYEYVRVAWNAAPVSIGGFATISGTNGDDTISGTSGGDFISGEKGNDIINAGDGNDVIYGGEGNDTLNGGNGDDTYIWNWGDGLDTIYDTANNDTISFGDGISFEDLTFQCVNMDDLKIFVKNNPNQGVIIRDFLSNNLNYKIEEISFMDGSQVHLSEIALTLKQLDIGETVTGTAFGDTIYAHGGNDTVNAGSGNDTIYGERGFDSLYGGDGNDTLIGGTGNDYLDGGKGDDIYVYNVGDGFDTISDYENSSRLGKNDKIKFGEGISFSDITFSRKGSNLVITLFNDITQGVIIQNFFSSALYHIEKLEFADGSFVSLTEMGFELVQNDGDDDVSGTNYDDTIYGGAGNDTITGGNGNDTIIGGKGNDLLYGGIGDDIYIYNLGDGFDTISDYEISSTSGKNDKIKFGEGISFDDLSFERGGDDLIIYVNNDKTQGITIQNYYSSHSQVEKLEFADGSIVDTSTIAVTTDRADALEVQILRGTDNNDTLTGGNFADTIYGGSGNDVINGGAGNDTINGENGNDTIIGGKGNDLLYGGIGDDIYIYNLGDGFDTISDYEISSTSGKNDKIKFGEGISFDDLSFERGGDNLIIYVNNDKTQGITIQNYYSSHSQVEKLEFADGSIVDTSTIAVTTDRADALEAQILRGTDNNDTLTGGNFADTIYGGSGNDVINGGAGNDTINGENGNDTIIGGKGNDLLYGGIGDDIYIYNLGDGFDTISDYEISSTSGKNDKIKFGEGISFDDLSFERGGDNLIIYVNNDKTQGITIQNYYSSHSQVEKLEFADGSIVDTSTIAVTTDRADALEAQILRGTDNNDTLTGGNFADTIYGGSGNDVINGGAGNDTITGENGNDTIIGGKGNDLLYGGIGDDIYIYNLGDGFDTISDYEISSTSGKNDKIKFGEGISFDDLSFERGGDDLIIYVNNDKTQGITIQNYYSSHSQVEKLEFADGSIVDTSTIIVTTEEQAENLGQTISGTSDDDILIGSDGDDTINAGDGYNDITGGKGNDIISAGYDQDTFYYNLGDGYDEITDLGGRDQIIFGNGISMENLSFYRKNDNLVILINENSSQGIEVKNFFQNNNNRIENIKFSDNSTLRLTSGLTLKISDLDGSITGTLEDDTLIGNIGENNMNGSSGDDILKGDKGNDILDGDSGNDTYIWNLGDDIDIIQDISGLNTIQFGEGISFDDLTFKRDGNNLRLIVKNDISQGIVIKDHFSSNNISNNYYPITIFEFSDGSKFDFRENNIALTCDNRDEIIIGHNGDNIIDAQGGDDTITTYGGDDIINGGAGDDNISSGNGNNTITGGIGNDVIHGETGNDTYIWNLGDGMDTITNSQGADKIVFGEGVVYDDLSFSQINSDLYINVQNTPNQGLLIKNYFASGNGNRIETLEFNNGSSFNMNTHALILKGDGTIGGTIYDDTITGNNNNDTIATGDGNDIIYGNAGNDNIDGGNGNDVIYGGKGYDTLKGGYGNDTYVWNLGDDFDIIEDNSGQNTLLFGPGINFNNLDFNMSGNNLLIFVNGDKTQGVQINNFLNENDLYKIEYLNFSDGTSIYLPDLGLNMTYGATDDTINGTYNDDTIIAGNGNDTINAGDGNDNIYGGKGNDALNGGNGRDNYYYNLDDGYDTITETRGNDKIIFGEGISLNNLTFRQNGLNLDILIDNNVSQGITIKNFYSGTNYQVETLQFADNTTFNLSTQGLTLQQTNADDTINGTTYNDVIYGNGGHDTINAGEGNDTLVGGIGNDTLNGGNGNDTYIYNLGDGYDFITDTGGNDKIIFGEGITQNNLVFEQIGNNLKISINGNDNKGIEINNHFNNENSRVEMVEFHDGSTLNIANADQLIQAMNSFDVSNSASTDTLSNPIQNVGDMYSLAINSELSQRS